MSKNTKKQQYLIPMEVTPETIRDFGIKKENVVPAKIGNKIVSAIMIPTDDEELYLTYMRPIWAEMKREERSRRCIVSDGKGSLKRCDMDCKACKKMKDGAPLLKSKVSRLSVTITDCWKPYIFIVQKQPRFKSIVGLRL